VMLECAQVLEAFQNLDPDWFHDDQRYKTAVVGAARMRILAMTKWKVLWDSPTTNPQLSWSTKSMSDLHLEEVCQKRQRLQIASEAQPNEEEEVRRVALQLAELEGLAGPDDHIDMPLDLDDNTALMLACKGGAASAHTRLLVDARASLTARNKEGRDAVLLAAQSGAVSSLRLLLLAQADPNTVDNGGLGAVMLAVSCFHREAAHLLLHHHANPNLPDRDGNTAVMLAARTGDDAMLRLLLDARPSLDLMNKDAGTGGTALLQAAKKGNGGAVELLIRARANLDCQNQAGGTALMWAALHGLSGIVESLLAAGANTALVDGTGQNALKIAMVLCPDDNPGKPEVIRLLRPVTGGPAQANNAGLRRHSAPTVTTKPCPPPGSALPRSNSLPLP